MRISTPMIMNNTLQHIQEGLEAKSILNERIASGKMFTVSSENPAAVSKVLDLRSVLTTSQAHLDNANTATDWMAATEFSLGQMTDQGKRALTLALEGISDTVGEEARINAMGVELEQMLESAAEIGNQEHQGKYIHAGYQINTKPFSLTANAGAPTTVNFIAGVTSADQIRMDVGADSAIQVNITGDYYLPFMNALANVASVYKNTPGDKTAIKAAYDQLTQAVDGLKDLRASFGTRQRTVQNSIDYMQKTQIEVKKLLSTKEDTDMAEAITSLRQKETSYQTTLEVAQRAISALNLFDYLR